MLSDDLREYEELCKPEDENIWYDTVRAMDLRYNLPNYMRIEVDNTPAYSQGEATDREIADLLERLHFCDCNALFSFLDKEFLEEYARRARYFHRHGIVQDSPWLGETKEK